MIELGDVAAAILAVRDLALETGVVEWMVLHLDRHALDLGVVARPFGTAQLFKASPTWRRKS